MKIIRNILAILIGIAIGSIVNVGLIILGPMIILPPEGADVTTEEGLKASIHLFKWYHFVFPFLAHAIGTLAGAFLAALIAANHKMKFALAIGVVFLIGGIMMIVSVPSPIWFSVLDIVGAYIPMAWIAANLLKK
ncbi:MAG: hypothetical protein KAH25_10270 [Bacteroidales bacterium]|nr:hypothetical protein [Bacteroidales bacterium]